MLVVYPYVELPDHDYCPPEFLSIAVFLLDIDREEPKAGGEQETEYNIPQG